MTESRQTSLVSVTRTLTVSAQNFLSPFQTPQSWLLPGGKRAAETLI